MGHGFKLFLLNFCHAVVRTMPDKPAPCYERALTPAARINDARGCGALNHCFINNLSAPLPFPESCAESCAQWRRSLPDRCVSLRASLECDLQCTASEPIRAACALSRRRSSSTKAAAQGRRRSAHPFRCHECGKNSLQPLSEEYGPRASGTPVGGRERNPYAPPHDPMRKRFFDGWCLRPPLAVGWSRWCRSVGGHDSSNDTQSPS
jgi:hypothetical protein